MSREAVLFITTPGSRSQTFCRVRSRTPEISHFFGCRSRPNNSPNIFLTLGVSTAQCGTILFGDGNATSDTGRRR